MRNSPLHPGALNQLVKRLEQQPHSSSKFSIKLRAEYVAAEEEEEKIKKERLREHGKNFAFIANLADFAGWEDEKHHTNNLIGYAFDKKLKDENEFFQWDLIQYLELYLVEHRLKNISPTENLERYNNVLIELMDKAEVILSKTNKVSLDEINECRKSYRIAMEDLHTWASREHDKYDKLPEELRNAITVAINSVKFLAQKAIDYADPSDPNRAMLGEYVNLNYHKD